MNFLLRSSTQINPAAADASATVDAERDYKAIVHSSSFNSLLPLPSGDFAMGDEFKGSGEFGSIWTRMPIEDHYDFPPEEGSILIPFRDFPENWASAPDMASLKFLDRDFIFPGEQFHILVHVRAHDPSGPEVVTPFKVAAAMNKLAARKEKETSSEGSNVVQEISVSGMPIDEDSTIKEMKVTDGESKAGEIIRSQEESQINPSTGLSASPTTLLQQEGNKKRNLMLLETFRKSHYYVRIMGEDNPLWKKRVVGAYEPSPSGMEGKGSEEQSEVRTHGCTPALMEGGKFDPHSAGGVARHAVACCSLGNGDIVVLLQVTMVADCISDDAFVEVLQFEQHQPPLYGSINENFGQQQLKRGSWDPSQGLLQWLLPLDRPSSPPPSFVNSIHNSPPKVASTPPNSNIFSFGHLRSSSGGSMPLPSPLPSPLCAPTYAPSIYGSKEWDSALQERSTRAEVGSEGLLSFRGAVLEPQRFSAHCGLEGPHVPGKRWRRKVSIFQPIKLESYFAHCNTQDLICVLVENSLPPTGKTAEVVIYVDSVNIVCQSAAPGSPPLPVPITCVEVGNDQQLPGLPLRAGEQHSFILRPTSPAWKPSPLDVVKHNTMGSARGLELQSLDGSFSQKKGIKDSSISLSATGQYAVIVSCHCSHTESRLHYKHPLQWRPRLPRDLLVSVSLESPTPTDSSDEIQPVFKSQVVTVQATNLTSQDMNLTLLAPSSLANSPLSMVSFPAPLSDSPATRGYSHQRSFHLNEKKDHAHDEPERDTMSPMIQELVAHSLESSLSLPPVQSIESVIGISPVLFRERNISAADIVADNSPARTHLWLQSTIPLGCVPAHSTTAVKCDILPLTDGIITLDTLHISTNEHDALYIPESPLQIYTTSSIATGVA